LLKSNISFSIKLLSSILFIINKTKNNSFSIILLITYNKTSLRLFINNYFLKKLNLFFLKVKKSYLKIFYRFIRRINKFTIIIRLI